MFEIRVQSATPIHYHNEAFESHANAGTKYLCLRNRNRINHQSYKHWLVRTMCTGTLCSRFQDRTEFDASSQDYRVAVEGVWRLSIVLGSESG